MSAPKKSRRPKKRPMPEDMPSNRALSSDSAPEKSPRPKKNPRRKAMGGSVDKYASGGKCRGMGAAKRGGRYTKAG